MKHQLLACYHHRFWGFPILPCAPISLRGLLLLLNLLPLVGGCGRQEQHSGPPHVILISLDTLRRDHVGVYDASSGVSTPNLDDLARSATVFENAFAPVPFTLPSHMTMLTGLHPEVHGVQGSKARLSPQVVTLAESLSANGFRTFGLVSNLWMKGTFGFSRGFDRYERIDYGLTYADRINQRLFEWLDQEPLGGSPLFLFLHYVDPHSDFFRVADNTLPYYSPPEFLESAGVEANSREFCDEQDNCATDYLLAVNKGQHSVSTAELERIRALYRSGVEALDRDLGSLFDGLRQRNLWDQSLVILTSDHGEEFLEHGEFIHSQPYVENLSIPLLFRLPAGELGGTRRSDVVRLTDLLPTVFDRLGIERPSGIEGRSLLPLIQGERLPPVTALGRDKKNNQVFTLRTEQYTLVHDFGSSRSELYDRLVDPNEMVDLQAERPEIVDRMRSGLETLLAKKQTARVDLGSQKQKEKILSKEEEEKLRAIGYLD